MKLGEFIENFSHNNIIRLIYKHEGGHKTVLDDWSFVSMDWEVNKGIGCFKDYINSNVLGIVGIIGTGIEDSINIVIENEKPNI